MDAITKLYDKWQATRRDDAITFVKHGSFHETFNHEACYVQGLLHDGIPISTNGIVFYGVPYHMIWTVLDRLQSAGMVAYVTEDGYTVTELE